MTKRKNPDDKKSSLRGVGRKRYQRKRWQRYLAGNKLKDRQIIKVKIIFNQQELKKNKFGKSSRLQVEATLSKNLSS